MSSFLFGCLFDFPPNGSNEDGHEGAEDVEEAVRKVG